MLKRFLKKFAKCIVCFAVIVGVLNVTNEPAKAVFIESSVAYGATQVIGSILVACGAYFTLSGDAQSVATSVFQDLKSNDKSTYDKIVNLVSPILSAGGLSGVSTVFRLSKELYDGIKASIERLFGTADAQEPVYSVGSIYDLNNYCKFEDFFIFDGSNTVFDDNSKNLLNYYMQIGNHYSSYSIIRYVPETGYISSIHDYKILPCPSGHSDCYCISEHIESDYSDEELNYYHYDLPIGYSLSDVISYGFVFSISDYIYKNDMMPYAACRMKVNYGYTRYYTNNTFFCDIIGSETNYSQGIKVNVSPYQGTMTYPGEDLVIQSPDIPDSLPDDMTDLPPLVLNPQDIVGDIPEEKLEDIVFDVPLPADEVGADIGTGTLPDVDEGEGEGTIPKPENPPDTDTDTGGILDILKDFFDSPSDFKLNFDAFKNIILLDRFPFCIPFDFIDSVKSFSVPAQDLKFTIAFDTKFLDVNHTVDLSPYQVPIKFFRATASVWFAVVLILKTRDLIKW